MTMSANGFDFLYRPECFDVLVFISRTGAFFSNMPARTQTDAKNAIESFIAAAK